MNRIPGLSTYRNWLNQQILPGYRISELIELGAFWTEVLLSDEKTGEQFWARLYQVEPHKEEALLNLWQDFSYTLEGLNDDQLQQPVGMKKVGKLQGFLSKYEDGIDLKSMLVHSGHLTTNRAITLVLQTIKALEKVYARGAAHFQIKPSNLILKPDGQILVKNFGLYEMENLFGKQIGAQHMWDVAYFSPEHFGDQELTIASDIYSLGLILFEMVTGQQPFSGQYQDVMNSQLKSMPPNPQALNPEINIGLARVLLRMLAKRKEQRFQSFSELRQALFLLLTPLEQVMFRDFTTSGNEHLDESESKGLNNDFSKVQQLKIQGDSKEALENLEGMIRMYGTREEFSEIALELADLLNHDTLESLVQNAEKNMKTGFPFKAINTVEQILSIHPFHSGAQSIFRKAYTLLDYSPLMALQPAIAIDLHLRLAENSKQEVALFALVRALLSDPQNEKAIEAVSAISGEPDPIDEKLEQVRDKRNQGDFTEALALLDSFLTQTPHNRRALILKKQISEQIHIMSMSKLNESGETIPISISNDIDDDFRIDPDEQHHLEEGILNIQIAIQNKKLDLANSELVELEKNYQHDPALMDLRHRLHTARQREELASLESRLKELLKLGDDNGCSLLIRDILKLEPGHKLAKAALAKLENRRTENTPSQQLLLEVQDLENQGNYESALNHLKTKIAQVPRTQELLNLEKKLEHTIQRQSERGWFLTEAQTMISKGNLNAAEEKIQQILRNFPQDPKALALLSQVEQLKKQPVPPQVPPVSENEILPPPVNTEPPLASVPQPLPPTTPVPGPESQITAPQPEKTGKSGKKSPLIPLLLTAVILIACGAGGYVFYKKQQHDKQLLAEYQIAEDLESQDNWSEALEKWKALSVKAPEFHDSLGRLRDLESRISQKQDQIDSLLERAQEYKTDGYLYDDSDQNAIVTLRTLLEIDPDNAQAQTMFEEIRDEEMETARRLFDEDRILEARDKYATVKLIDPDFSDPAFEEKVGQWVEETVVTPAIATIQKSIKRKKWDKALELSAQLRTQLDSVPTLDALWDTIYSDLQERVKTEKKKTKTLKLLDLMVRIHPEDEALVLKKNELNRELNQAQIDSITKRMERAHNKGQLITTGTQAKKLLALDSENELARERLYDAIGRLKTLAEGQAANNPTKAIGTYRSLLQIDNMKTYRTAISRLQTRLNKFNASLEKVHQSMNKPYTELAKIVARAVENSRGFEKEKDYIFLQKLKTGIEKEHQNIQKIMSWEKSVRDDSSQTYASILKKIKGYSGFKYGFSKQELARLAAVYEDKIENYTGNLTVVIKKASNLPRGSGLRKTPDTFAQFIVGSTKCKTESVKSTSPLWNHICQFNVQPGDDMVLTVFSKGFVKKQTAIGSIRLPKVPKTGTDQVFKSQKGWSVTLDIRRAR